jgi:hypothetical protein
VGIQFAGATDLLLVRPATGAIRGRWRFDGIITPPQEGKEVMTPLPEAMAGAWSTLERRIMIAGQRKADAAPCLSVIEADGKEVQQLTFPLLGVEEKHAVSVIDLRADWAPDRPEVVIDTSEGLYVSFLVEDRLLADPVASPPDDFERRYDERNDEGAYARLIEAAGGEAAYWRDVARRVTGVR